MTLAFTGRGGGGSSSLGRRLRSRRGGVEVGGSDPRRHAISPLVIVLAGTFLSFFLMALGWSVIINRHGSANMGQHDAISTSMLRARLHRGHATSTVNDDTTKIRHPLTAELHLPTPILVMGLPKCGTTSITSYFRCAGIRSSHFSCEVNDDDDQTRPWRNCLLPQGAGGGARSDAGTQPLCAVCIERNIKRGRPPFEGCGPYDVFGEMDSAEHPLPMLRSDARYANYVEENAAAADDATTTNDDDKDTSIQPLCSFPQIMHLEEIHASYPNATFILNTRPVDNLIKSISNWNPTPNRADRGYLRRVLAQCDLGPAFGPGVGATDEELKRFYLAHSEHIRGFAKQHPSHALVEVDIEDDSTGDVMQDSFGINKQCWGKQNSASPELLAQNPNRAQLQSGSNVVPHGEGEQAAKHISPRILDEPQGDVLHVATSTVRGTKHNLTSAIAASQAQAELLFAQFSAQKSYNAEMALDYPYCSDIQDIFPQKAA